MGSTFIQRKFIPFCLEGFLASRDLVTAYWEWVFFFFFNLFKYSWYTIYISYIIFRCTIEWFNIFITYNCKIYNSSFWRMSEEGKGRRWEKIKNKKWSFQRQKDHPMTNHKNGCFLSSLVRVTFTHTHRAVVEKKANSVIVSTMSPPK